MGKYYINQYIKNVNKSSNNNSVPKTRILEVTNYTEGNVTVEEFLSLLKLDDKPITEEQFKSLDLVDGPIVLRKGNQTMNCIVIETLPNGTYKTMLFGGASNSDEIGYGIIYRLTINHDTCYIHYYEV